MHETLVLLVGIIYSMRDLSDFNKYA